MVYNYTKPRGPIAAMYGSPGPVYALPPLVGTVGPPQHDPRSVHTRAPAYHFGIPYSQPTSASNIGPGPCKYYPDSRMSRDGRDGTPQYSLYARRQELKPFSTPAPGTYAPESAYNKTQDKPPAYSFGGTFRKRRTDQTPGPNVYSPPPMLGRSFVSDKRQAPAYSIYGRSKVGGFDEDYQKTPGPGTYRAIDPNQYRDRQPVYSLTGRNVMPGDPTQKPGPGANNAEMVAGHTKQSPKYSFGIRHSEYEAPLIVQVEN